MAARAVTTFTAYYDLAIGPASFDFVVFGIKAKMHAAIAKADRLHFVIVPDADSPGGIRPKRQFYDTAEQTWRLWNIVIPACQLLGATFTLAADWLQAERLASGKDWKQWPEDWRNQTLANRHHLIGDVIALSRAGAAVPRIEVPEHARRSVKSWMKREFIGLKTKGIVTLTRRSTYLPERNSEWGEWTELRDEIEEAGYWPIVLEDTATALQEGRGYGELNLALRAAMYEEADLNLQANNGAASLCWFGSKPYRMFGCGDEHWDGLFVKQGLPLGESWPWAGSEQRLCYGKETADQMIAEFDAWA